MQSFARSSKWLAINLSAEAHILALSSGASQLIGYPVQGIVGLPLAQILDDGSARQVPHMLDMAAELGYWSGDIIYGTLEGRFIEAQGMLLSMAGKGNSAAEYLLVITPNQSLEPNQEGSSVLCEIADTLRTLAHDLNNPLAAMMGFSQLLVLNENCHGQVREDIEKIYSELNRVVQIVERLQEYARSLYQKPDSYRASGNMARHV